MPYSQESELLDYIALRRLQNRYADLVTRQAWSELTEIFRPTCTLDLALGDRNETVTGPAAIGHFISEAIARFSFFEFAILNTVIEIDGIHRNAVARMYMQELRLEVDSGRRTDAYGVYHDRFEKDDDGHWWFTERHYGSYSRTAPHESKADQVVFPLPDRNLREWLAEIG